MKLAVIVTVALMALALVAMGFAADWVSEQCGYSQAFDEDIEGPASPDDCVR